MRTLRLKKGSLTLGEEHFSHQFLQNTLKITENITVCSEKQFSSSEATTMQ